MNLRKKVDDKEKKFPVRFASGACGKVQGYGFVLRNGEFELYQRTGQLLQRQ